MTLGLAICFVSSPNLQWIVVLGYGFASISEAAAFVDDDLPEEDLPPINQPLPHRRAVIAFPLVVKFASASRRDGKGVKVAK